MVACNLPSARDGTAMVANNHLLEFCGWTRREITFY